MNFGDLLIIPLNWGMTHYVFNWVVDHTSFACGAIFKSPANIILSFLFGLVKNQFWTDLIYILVYV